MTRNVKLALAALLVVAVIYFMRKEKFVSKQAHDMHKAFNESDNYTNFRKKMGGRPVEYDKMATLRKQGKLSPQNVEGLLRG